MLRRRRMEGAIVDFIFDEHSSGAIPMSGGGLPRKKRNERRGRPILYLAVTSRRTEDTSVAGDFNK
jgi:hypothetical protein